MKTFKTMRMVFLLALLGISTPLITACDNDDGTFEQMGESMDEAGEEISDEIDDATDAR